MDKLTETPIKLTVERQEKLLSQVHTYLERQPYSDVYCFRVTQPAWCAVGLTSAYTYWYSAFRGSMLYRYGKGRTFTLFNSLLIGLMTGIGMGAVADIKLWSPYRKESPHTHGFHAALLSLYMNCLTLSSGAFVTYTFASTNGVVISPNRPGQKGLNLDIMHIFLKDIKPYRSHMLGVCAATTLAMYVHGAMKYHKSCEILERLSGVRTLS